MEPTTNKGFCPHCGKPLAGVTPGWVFCSPSCKRKIGGVCKDVAKRVIDCIVYSAQADGRDPGEAMQLRKFADRVWDRLAKPVQSADCSILGIGNRRTVMVLAALMLDSFALPHDLDGELYDKLVQNGWVDFNDNTDTALARQEPQKSAPPRKYPWS